MLNTVKMQVSELLHLSKDALHIHLGLGIYFAAMLVFRRGPGSWVPWLVVLAFQIANEILDSWGHEALSMLAPASLKDVANTMLWPTVLMIAARYYERGKPRPAMITIAKPAAAE